MIDISKAYTQVSYIDFWYSDYLYPNIRIHDYHRRIKHFIPGIGEINSLTKAYNNITDYLDSKLSEFGKSLRMSNDDHVTYLYMGGTLVIDNDTFPLLSNAIIRVYGRTVGAIQVDKRTYIIRGIIIDTSIFNDPVPSPYTKDVMIGLTQFINTPYEIRTLNTFKWKEGAKSNVCDN